MSDFLPPHELQHTRFPYPSLSHGVCSGSCPLSWWCYLIISSSATLFFFCLQSFPASGSFPRSQILAQVVSVGASASVSVLPMNIQGYITLRINWFDPLKVQWTLKNLLQHHTSKASILQCSAFFFFLIYFNWRLITLLGG